MRAVFISTPTSYLQIYLASSIFIPNASLPSWLRQLAAVLPVERLSDALHRPYGPAAHGPAIAWTTWE